MVGMRMRIAAVMTAAVLAVGGASAATAAPPDTPGGPRYTAGAEGEGDAYFPYAGNGGYGGAGASAFLTPCSFFLPLPLAAGTVSSVSSAVGGVFSRTDFTWARP